MKRRLELEMSDDHSENLRREIRWEEKLEMICMISWSAQ